MRAGVAVGVCVLVAATVPSGARPGRPYPDRLYFGGQEGADVRVVSAQGLGTARAVMRVRHVRADAVTYCREVERPGAACVREAMAQHFPRRLTADCPRGTFGDMHGRRYRFDGPWRGEGHTARYRLLLLPYEDPLDGSHASGYGVAMQVFLALCPGRAPTDP